MLVFKNSSLLVSILLIVSPLCFANSQTIYLEDFQSGTFGDMTPVSVASYKDWTIWGFSGQTYAYINGRVGNEPADDWLISPAFNLTNYSNETLSFQSAFLDEGPDLEVLVSNNYNPALHTNPADADWTALSPALPTTPDLFIDSGELDMSFIDGENVYFAFHYIASGVNLGEAKTWKVDTIKLKGQPETPAIVKEDFNSDTLGQFTAYSRQSSADWQAAQLNGQDAAVCNGQGADQPSEDWLISPAIDMSGAANPVCHFDYLFHADGPDIQIKVSSTYSGSGDPLAGGVSWQSLPLNLCDVPGQWQQHKLINIPNDDNTVYIAFVYSSSGLSATEAKVWGVDNFKVADAVSEPISVDFNVSHTDATNYDEITFTPLFSGGVGPFSFSWIFGDGQSSNETNPTYTYSNSGDYTISLTITDGFNNPFSETKADLITITAKTLEVVPVNEADVRITTFNTSMYGSASGQIASQLASANDPKFKNIAETIQHINPDIILLNEFDYDDQNLVIQRFKQNYLEISQNGTDPVFFDYYYAAPSNTGIPTPFDFNNNGKYSEPEDCYGYGKYPGQYAFAVLSKYPILTDQIRTFQMFLWKDMPGAVLPMNPLTPDDPDDFWYNPDEIAVFRLSSKNHCDVPVNVNGEIIHLLCSHPTPPVFDGPEDFNGRRNHDEIRFWADYVTPGQNEYIYDDDGVQGGLDADKRFVILGDQNADPVAGDSFNFAARQFINHPLIDSSFTPTSNGSIEFSGDPCDTATFLLRADYVLPSKYGFKIANGGVFWPTTNDLLYYLFSDGSTSTDHRPVWLDLFIKKNDLTDFQKLAAHWLRNDCQPPYWCSGTDFYNDNTVGIDDLERSLTDWLDFH